MHDKAAFSYSRVLLNSISNCVGYVARAVVAFFLLRYVVRHLGAEQYSILPLVDSCMAYLLLLNLGTGMGMARYISAAHARGDADEVGRLFTSMFVVMAGLGAVLLAAGSLVSWQFSNILTIPAGLENAALLLMCLTVVTTALRMPFNVLQSAFVATESYWLSNAIGVTADVLRAILIVASFEFFGVWVVWTAVATTIATLATTACEWYAVRRILPSARLKLSLFNARAAFRVMSFSAAVFVGTISGVLYWDTDRIVINKFLSPEQLTLYAVVTTVALSGYQVINVPTTVLFPVIARAEATNNVGLVRELVYRGTRLCVLISLPCWLLFAVLAKPFFHWYLGDQCQSVDSFVLYIAAVMFFANATSILRLVPVPMGKPLFISLSELAFALLNLVITLAFVGWFRWGLAGVALGTFVAIAIKNTVLVPWYVARLVHLNVLTLLRNILYAAVPTGAGAIALVGLVHASPGSGPLWFMIPAGVALAVLFAFSYAIGLPPPERRRISRLIVVALKAVKRFGAYCALRD
jgi:O-antigen/teichoic acid export membrane protein